MSCFKSFFSIFPLPQRSVCRSVLIVTTILACTCSIFRELNINNISTITKFSVMTTILKGSQRFPKLRVVIKYWIQNLQYHLCNLYYVALLNWRTCQFSAKSFIFIHGNEFMQSLWPWSIPTFFVIFGRLTENDFLQTKKSRVFRWQWNPWRHWEAAFLPYNFICLQSVATILL